MPVSRLLARSSVAILSAVLVAACAKKEQANTDSAATAVAPPADTAAAAAASAPTLTDAQIAHVALTANSGDSAAGVMAKQKATSKDVKAFAQMMVTDHGGANKQATALAKKLNLTPEDNDVSRQLKSSVEQATTNLQSKTGADFDKAYIENEVTVHQNVLDALDKTLIPQAQNADLKALLQKVRPMVAAHLDRAKKIQSGSSTTQ